MAEVIDRMSSSRPDELASQIQCIVDIFDERNEFSSFFRTLIENGIIGDDHPEIPNQISSTLLKNNIK